MVAVSGRVGLLARQITEVHPGEYADLLTFSGHFQNLPALESVGTQRQVLAVLFKAANGHGAHTVGAFQHWQKFFFS